MRIAYWIPKATKTSSEYVILVAIPRHNDCSNAPQCYVKRILPVLLGSLTSEYSASFTVKGYFSSNFGNFSSRILLLLKTENFMCRYTWWALA